MAWSLRILGAGGYAIVPGPWDNARFDFTPESVKEMFEMIVPGDQKAMLAGLEGSTKFHRKMEGAKIVGGKDGVRMDNVDNTVAGASQSSI